MGTRSNIIVPVGGRFRRVYCHWDGYPGHVGAILVRHYEKLEKARELVSYGDMSSLGKDIGVRISFDGRVEHDEDGFPVQCRFYGRDRGDALQEVYFDGLSEAWPGRDSWIDWAYVLDLDRGWLCGRPGRTGLKNRRPVVDYLDGEDA